MRYRRSIDPRRIWCTVALNLAICGAAATSAHADDLLYFEKQIAPFTKKPEFVAPGPAFDVQTCMKGGVEQTADVKKYADGRRADRLRESRSAPSRRAIVNTKGHMNALVLIATGPFSTDSMMAGIDAELKQCDNCKAKVMNFSVVD
jgi:hypothetical protein